MAFTSTQKVKICDITGIDLETLSGHLIDVTDFVTAEIETSVIAEIALWDANYTNSHIQILGTQNPQGANVKFTKLLSDLRNRVINKLYLHKYVTESGRLLRG